jgi:hypothetical protein
VFETILGSGDLLLNIYVLPVRRVLLITRTILSPASNPRRGLDAFLLLSVFFTDRDLLKSQSIREVVLHVLINQSVGQYFSKLKAYMQFSSFLCALLLPILSSLLFRH